MRPIRTLEDLIHSVTNSLTLISSHSQYLLGKRPAGAAGAAELQVIYEEAELAASLLGLVPRGLARLPVQDTPPGTTMGGQPPESLDPLAVEQPRGAGGPSHGKRRR